MNDQLERIPAPSSNDDVIADALAVIDGALAQMMNREILSSGEVADVLLDVRSALTSAAST
jgi:hypothetical protein